MRRNRPTPRRSGCPLNAALEVLGDRWSLLIVRDMLFGGATTYRELASCPERIATNVLAARLESLEEIGIVTKAADPEDGRRWTYTLTEKGLDLAPAMVELMLWGDRYHETAAPRTTIRQMTRDREGFLSRLRAGRRSADRDR